MSNQVVKPEEFGLSTENVQEIENAFLPKLKEREQYVKVYDHLLSKPLTPELCKEAKSLRLKLVKVRTGIASIHKTQKAYFLAAGRFVDAWKNKETEPVQQMEKKLSEVESHFENIERERIQRLHDQRMTELKKFNPLSVPDNLGVMDEDTFIRLLDREKRNFEYEEEQRRIKDEEDRLLAQKKQLGIDRRELALPYYDFWSQQEKTLDFSEVSEEDFNNFISRVKDEKKIKDEYDLEQKRIASVRSERAKKLAPYIHFVKDYEGMLSMSEEDFSSSFSDAELAAKKHFEFEEKEKKRLSEEKQKRCQEAVEFLESEGFEKYSLGMTHDVFGSVSSSSYNNLNSDEHLLQFKQSVLKNKEVELLKISREKAEKELSDRIKKEEQLRLEEEKKIQDNLSKNDSEKVSDLVSYLGSVKEKFVFESDRNKQMFNNVCVSIDGIIKTIK